MPVFAPHGPVHEETEFWYDIKEKALLYEVNFVERHERVEADHQRTRGQGTHMGPGQKLPSALSAARSLLGREGNW